MRTIRSLTAGLVSTGAVLALALPTPAQAATTIPIDWKVDASTTMKNLGMTVNVPTGSFKGAFNLDNATLSGEMTLPQASKRIDLGPLPLATVVFAMEPAGPVSGTVEDFATLKVKVKAQFNVRIVSIKPLGSPVNLVGRNCRTVSPVVSELGGNVNLAGKTTFKGTYALPRFRNCGLLVTPVINSIIPGPGNSFAATFYP